MELSGSLFHSAWLVLFGAVYLVALWYALRWADWSRLKDARQQHVWLGTIVFLFFLWNMRVEIQPGFYWHLSGMVIITLMLRWSLAILAGSLALLGVVLAGFNDWSGFLPSAVFAVVLPATLTQVILGLTRAYAPKHFFVYVLVNAFAAGGFIFLVMSACIVGGLLSLGVYPWHEMKQNFLYLMPMMFFPESMLNGWLAAMIVIYKPHWIISFSDEEYLHGK
jgi:uncharacterized membrane protein